jgi:4-hydroxy-tetrahydrodipicolinate synthase
LLQGSLTVGSLGYKTYCCEYKPKLCFYLVFDEYHGYYSYFYSGDTSMFHGSMVAIITPMHEDRTIDFTSLIQLVEWHITSQTDAIVVLGTTGESATMTKPERQQILETVVTQVAGRIPVIAGTGSNSTAESILLTEEAMKIGVDACLLVTPYYNKPTQEGLYQHFKAIASAVAIPQILYNVPSRTVCDLLPETVVRLADITNIIGLKDATGEIQRVEYILQRCSDKIDLYSGDDATTLDFMIAGGKGVISVTANVAPHEMHEMCCAVLHKDYTIASKINEKLMPLHKQLFIEANPIPVKWALHQMGKIPLGIRLPLTELSQPYQEVVYAAMQQANINVKSNIQN